jgi:hypothetical protein
MFSRSHHILLVFIVLVYSQLTLAQTGTIKGKVVDVTNTPVIGASVQILTTTKGVPIGVSGLYTLSDVPAGEITLKASIIGYKTVKKVVAVKSDSVSVCDFILEEERIINDPDAWVPPIKAISNNTDRIRVAETYRLADSLGNRIWPGWTDIPFPILLIMDSREYLIRHPYPDSTFTKGVFDSLLKAPIYLRPRTFPPSLQASFPFDNVPTTVIGTAENTDSKTSTPWIITLLHEHFHQLQDSKPGYFEQVDKLGLSGGDKTGMWMLNYPFPYDSASVQAEFDKLKVALGDAVNAPDSLLSEKFKNYCAVRKDFSHKLKEADWKYMSFQLWQEGVARYTELRVAEWAADNYHPTPDFEKLQDYEPITKTAVTQLQIIKKAPYKVSLGQFQRASFYIIGSAEAYLLDRVNPKWKDNYFQQLFTLDPYFAQ